MKTAIAQVIIAETGGDKANKYLKAALGRAALKVAKQKDGFLPKRYKRIANRRGKPRAIVATEHTIITDATTTPTPTEPANTPSRN